MEHQYPEAYELLHVIEVWTNPLLPPEWSVMNIEEGSANE